VKALQRLAVVGPHCFPETAGMVSGMVSRSFRGSETT